MSARQFNVLNSRQLRSIHAEINAFITGRTSIEPSANSTMSLAGHMYATGQYQAAKDVLAMLVHHNDPMVQSEYSQFIIRQLIDGCDDQIHRSHFRVRNVNV